MCWAQATTHHKPRRIDDGMMALFNVPGSSLCRIETRSLQIKNSVKVQAPYEPQYNRGKEIQETHRSLSRNPMLRVLLKIELQRDLHGTCSPQLIDGTEPAELAGERGVRLAKERSVVQRVVDGAEAGMIEDVVGFDSEL